MACNVSWYEDHVHWVYAGHTTAQEILDHNLDFVKNPLAKNLTYVLFDVLGVTSYEIDKKDIDFFALFDMTTFLTYARLRIALVADDPRMREILETYTSGHGAKTWSFGLFDNLDTAREWGRKGKKRRFHFPRKRKS